MGEINSFQQLDVWQEAHKLVLVVHKVTKHFPDEEKYGLVSRIRRAVVSVPPNITKGFKRRGIQDKIRFYNSAEDSL